jgi:tRNA nucleotidyltransferase (CCA-adding enzyme)
MAAQIESSAHWEHFRHGADIGVRGWGPTIASALEQAAMAMMAVIVDPGKVRADETIEVECEAPSLDLLLYDWLNRLILEMATRQMMFTRFDVDGEAISRERHRPAVEIKGATMTELAVGEIEPGLWRAQCVVDV